MAWACNARVFSGDDFSFPMSWIFFVLWSGRFILGGIYSPCRLWRRSPLLSTFLFRGMARRGFPARIHVVMYHWVCINLKNT